MLRIALRCVSGMLRARARLDSVLLVVCSQRYGLVHGLENVWLDEVALAQNADRGAVSVEKSTVFRQLLELDLGHGHEGIDLVLGALEVLDAEGVDGDDLDASLVADFEYLHTCQWAARGTAQPGRDIP
jgi:hypothetical protein